jgi:hypothetical protein
MDIGVEGKWILASLSEAAGADADGVLSEREAMLVRKHVPWTRIVGDRRTTIEDGTLRDLPALLHDEQRSLIVKRTHSKSGWHFAAGAEKTADEWREIVRTALADSSPWVVQRNLRADPVEFCYFDDAGNGVMQPQGYVYSPYVFGDRCGPAWIRVERDPLDRRVGMPATSAVAMAGTVVV